jgi:glycosyltransferase involved in cell wall biosynthesis
VKLSILIPSLYTQERIDLFSRLKCVLYPQLTPDVEIIPLIDHGEISIGVKRNHLLSMAKGEYISFVDDDDLVSSNYVQQILNAIATGPDVVGIKLIHYLNGYLLGKTEHSIKYKEWKNTMGGDGLWQFTRCPNHLNPVKRELALRAGFPDKVYGEDKDYSLNLVKLISTEVMIHHPIYYYMQRQ